MSRLYKRGKVWWGYWTDELGRHHRRSLQTKDRQVAQHRLRRLELGIASPDDTAPEAPANENLAPVPDLDRLLKDYLATIKNDETKSSYTQKAGHLNRILGGSQLTKEAVDGYVEQRLSEWVTDDKRVSPHTVHKELVVLRQCLKHAGLDYSIVPKIDPEYQPKDVFLSREQFLRLFRLLPRKRQVWVAVATFLGLRDSEVTKITKEHVRADGAVRIIRVPGTKTKGAWRWVPVPDPLVEFLDDLPAEPWPNVRRDLHVAAEAANRRHPAAPKVPMVSPNDLRRSYASWLVQAGVPHLTVARLLGHSSVRMVERVYGQLDVATMQKAVDLTFGSWGANAEDE